MFVPPAIPVPPDYSNPQLPDGVNVSHTHPLADIARLLGGIVIVVVVAVLGLALAAGWLASHIPFEAEASVAKRFESQFVDADASPATVTVQCYLEQLTARVAAASELPPGMAIRVHYLSGDTVNAFATLGGHIMVYQGLMQRMPSENALANVIGHEIGHVKLRHPVSSMGRGLVIGVALSLVSATAGTDVVAAALGPAGLLAVTSFSREQERAADAQGLEALVTVYGHANGAADTFRRLEEATRDLPRPPAIFSTHPLTDDRIAAIDDKVRSGNWKADGPLVQYPDDVVRALAAPAKAEHAAASPVH